MESQASDVSRSLSPSAVSLYPLLEDETSLLDFLIQDDSLSRTGDENSSDFDEKVQCLVKELDSFQVEAAANKPVLEATSVESLFAQFEASQTNSVATEIQEAPALVFSVSNVNSAKCIRLDPSVPKFELCEKNTTVASPGGKRRKKKSRASTSTLSKTKRIKMESTFATTSNFCCVAAVPSKSLDKPNNSKTVVHKTCMPTTEQVVWNKFLQKRSERTKVEARKPAVAPKKLKLTKNQQTTDVDPGDPLDGTSTGFVTPLVKNSDPVKEKRLKTLHVEARKRTEDEKTSKLKKPQLTWRVPKCKVDVNPVVPLEGTSAGFVTPLIKDSDPVEDERLKTVYVGRLPLGISKDFLIRMFSPFGNIAHIFHCVKSGYCNCYGFVTFEDAEDAAAALIAHSNDPFMMRFDISYGYRRSFCKRPYCDLDSESSEDSGISSPSPMDYDQLLAESKAKNFKK